MFLEPFSRVLGPAASKKVLLTVAQSDARHLSCLHRLGIVLGITEWVKDYQRKWNLSQSHSSVGHVAPLEQIKVGKRQKSLITPINMSLLYEVHLAPKCIIKQCDSNMHKSGPTSNATWLLIFKICLSFPFFL